MSHLRVVDTSFSFRPPEPARDGAELLAEIRERGGRVYRMREERVFCLTDDAELAEWLLKLGARGFAPRNYGAGLDGLTPGAFFRARPQFGGKVEYDLWLTPIVTEGLTLWEAAG
jgi:hypothetical protein